MITSRWRVPAAAVIIILGATSAVRTQAPPMGIVDLLNKKETNTPTNP
jgi:hypothetical protein